MPNNSNQFNGMGGGPGTIGSGGADNIDDFEAKLNNLKKMWEHK